MSINQKAIFSTGGTKQLLGVGKSVVFRRLKTVANSALCLHNAQLQTVHNLLANDVN